MRSITLKEEKTGKPYTTLKNGKSTMVPSRELLYPSTYVSLISEFLLPVSKMHLISNGPLGANH